jgi:RNA polymerase sigma factor (sigma-70 family)
MVNNIDSAPDLKMLLQQVRAGSSDAAWQLIDLYWPHIYRVVHRRMDSRLRSGFDSEDFVQAVWLSFFKDPGKIHSFESSGQLIAYLVRMANNKILEEHRRNLALKRNNSKQPTSLDDSNIDRNSIVSRRPSPSAVAIVRERWNQLLAGQPRHYMEIVRLRTMGAKTSEIASQVNMDSRSVRKVIDRLLMGQSW